MITRDEIDRILLEADSFSRINVLIEILPQLSGGDYWYALGFGYQICDNLGNYSSLLRELFLSDEPERSELMTSEEKDYLDNLPEEFTIYRGMTKIEQQSNNFGLSWTLKKDTAEFFANNYGRNFSTEHMEKTVHQLTVKKKDVIAFFDDRDEDEIIYIQEEL